MKHASKLLLLGSLAAMLGGCVRKSDYDAHIVNHEAMRDSITAWSVRVHAWQSLTQNVICDIIAKNTPDVGPYAPQTLGYCPSNGTEGDGEPPDPPEIGQF